MPWRTGGRKCAQHSLGANSPCTCDVVIPVRATSSSQRGIVGSWYTLTMLPSFTHRPRSTSVGTFRRSARVGSWRTRSTSARPPGSGGRGDPFRRLQRDRLDLIQVATLAGPFRVRNPTVHAAGGHEANLSGAGTEESVPPVARDTNQVQCAARRA